MIHRKKRTLERPREEKKEEGRKGEKGAGRTNEAEH